MAATYTFGQTPADFVEIIDPLDSTQTIRPAAGLVLTVQDAATLEVPTELTDLGGSPITQVATTTAGYFGFKASAPVVRVSADSGTTWDYLYSKEALDAAIAAGSTAVAASAEAALAKANAATAQARADEAYALAAAASATSVVTLSGDQTINGVKTFSSSPIVPTPTAAGHAVTKAYVDAAVAGGGSAGLPGYVALDSFGQSTDDANLTAALAYVATQTNPPVIVLGNKNYSFSTARTLTQHGIKLMGVPGYANAEKSDVNMGTRANISVSGGVWLTGRTDADTYDLSIQNIAFRGTSSTQFMASGGSYTFYCTLMRDLSFSNFKSVIGSQATKALFTAAQFDGYWEVNNSYNGAIHIGGSDNVLWSDGMLLDSGTAFNTAGSAAGQSHLWLDYCEKSDIGPLYVTAEGNWGAVRVSGPAYNAGGSNLGGPNVITGARIEGRNAGAPCNGALVRVDGGILILRDCWLGYAGASPSSLGRSPVDAGAVHVNGGMLLAGGCTYDKATSVAASFPVVALTGAGSARLSNFLRGSKGGTWSTLFATSNTGTGTLVKDDTFI